jgi:hypothetical protein
MVKFFKHIFIILVVIIIIAFVVDKCIFEFFFRYHKRTKLDVTGLSKEVVFFGSSRCIHHVNPKIIDSLSKTTSYNMGWAASNPREIYAALKIYLSRNNAPKLVCIQLDMEHDDTTEDDLARQSLLKFYGKNMIDDYFSENLQNNIKIPMLASIKYRDFGWREILKTMFNNLNKSNQNLGFEPIVANGFNDKSNSFKIIGKGNLLNQNKWISKSIALCRSKNIKVLLFTTPIFKMSNGFFFERLYNLYEIEYFNDVDSLGDKRYFFDQTHLNSIGADEYSKILATHLNSLN